MALDGVKNFAVVTVSTGYDDTATSIVLAGSEGAKLPDPATANYNLVWWDSTNYSEPALDPKVEIVRCTAKSTDTLTVTRAQESTTAQTKNTGSATYKMALAVTAKTITDIGTDLDAKVTKALFDANTILAANSDNTPAAVTIAEQQVAGRLTGGDIKGLSTSELTGLITDADESNKGKIEIATTAEVIAGTDASKAVTPAGITNGNIFTNEKVATANSVPTMTSNTAPSGVASASTFYDANFAAWKAFDHDTATAWVNEGVGTPFPTNPAWLQYQFTTAKVVTKYVIYPRVSNNGQAPSAWTFQGSMDGVNWTVLDTQSGKTFSGDAAQSFRIYNVVPYLYYKLNMTAGGSSNYVSIGELEIWGKEANSISSITAVNSVNPTSPNRTITIYINGTVYYISAKTTND